MSAIAGICYWDGRPIAEADLAVMADHNRAAGPDGGGTVSPIPGLAMQAHVLHFDQLSEVERQPHPFGQGSVLTWDGRLDNRDDLLITLHHDLGPDITDAALVAAAYARWGLDCLPRLIGDWSLAIWDAPNRRIVLARDYMGNRPLHYMEIPGGLAWASSLDALADCFDRYGHPDETYIAGILTYGVPPGVTPFAGIPLLRSGHLLLASESAGVQVRRYWTFEPSSLRYRDPREYTDHLRVLLTDAVRVRLRARGRVWAHLSGGFDSSTIVCLSNVLIQRRQVEAPAVQPISHVSSTSPESDESRYIEAVERWCGLTSVRRDSTRPWPTFEERLTHRRPFSYGVDDVLESPMVAAGDRIVLSGEMGDLVMVRGGFEVVSLLEPLHEGRPLEFLRQSLARSKRRQRPLLTVLARVAMAGYFPHLNRAVSHRRRNALRAREQGTRRGDISAVLGVTQDLLARAPRPNVIDYPSISRFRIVKRHLVDALYRWTDLGAASNSDLTPCVWRTFPYTHRPLVAMVLAAPQLAFWHPLVTRSGMKRAFTDVLPQEILSRTSKGDPQPALDRAAAANTELLSHLVPADSPTNWDIVRLRYIRSDSLTRDLQMSRQGRPSRTAFLSVSVGLEAWLRTMNSTPPHSAVSSRVTTLGSEHRYAHSSWRQESA